MFKHYCDICGKELFGDAKQLTVSEMEVPSYETDVYSSPSVSCCSTSGIISCKPEKLYSKYEICNSCARDIERKCRHD